MENPAHRYLLCRIAERSCGLPLEHVLETLRPQPMTPLKNAPPFVRGVSILRGEAVPVIDGCALLGGAPVTPTRLLRLSNGHGRIALLVDSVLGAHLIPDGDIRTMPQLLDPTHQGAVGQLGALDRETFLVLQSARLLGGNA